MCGKPLAGEDFKKAYEKLREEVQKETSKELKTSEADWKERLGQLKKTHEEELKHDTETLKSSFDSMQKQTTDLFAKNLKDTEALLKVNFEKQLKEKDSELKKANESVKEAQKEINKRAGDLAKTETAKLQQQITERELELKRAKDVTEELQKKLSQSSSELKGEAGELNLYSKLSEAFPEDKFTTKKKGKKVGDIIQNIRMKNGKLIEMPIVYDNKVADRLTRTDFQKANEYKTVHKTRYVIIVSSNLPKEIKNGTLGDKEGVLLASPSIVVDLAKQIREFIIDIWKTAGSNTDRELKESKLYEYVRSPEFVVVIQKLNKVSEELNKLQATEEVSHQTVWKRRKELEERLRGAYTDLESEIASILSEQGTISNDEPIALKESIIKKKKKKFAFSNI